MVRYTDEYLDYWGEVYCQLVRSAKGMAFSDFLLRPQTHLARLGYGRAGELGELRAPDTAATGIRERRHTGDFVKNLPESGKARGIRP